MNRLGIVLLVSVFTISLQAQEFAYGFKVGLNFSTLRADSEMDMNGNELETFNYSSGFHVGAAFIYRITDLVGVRGELLYNQKGLEYGYDGTGFQLFIDSEGDEVLSRNGDRKYFLDVSNSYIDIPISAYYKIGEKLEVYGGIYASILVASTAEGTFSYAGAVPGFPDINEEFTLEYQYFGDTPLFPGGVTNTTENDVVLANNTRNITIPRQLGAYDLDFTEKDGSFYNILDFGLTGGLAFYINSGLFLSGTVNYGLVDTTNDFYDISRTETNGNEYISRADKDTNLSIQASIGFSF